jgi:hypothetical protein
MSVLDALMAYNGTLFGPSLLAIALLLSMGVVTTFSRFRIPAWASVWMAWFGGASTLGVSWFSMLQMRSILFSNGIHVPIREHLDEIEAAASVLLVLTGLSWCLVGWLAGIAVCRLRSPAPGISHLSCGRRAGH